MNGKNLNEKRAILLDKIQNINLEHVTTSMLTGILDKMQKAEATPYASVGDYLIPDGWEVGKELHKADGYYDSSFAGCEFRLHSNLKDKLGRPFYQHAINIVITGKKIDKDGYIRCRIEFVGDDEPSEYKGGKISLRYLPSSYKN